MKSEIEQPITDFMEISRDLEVHHAVFYQLWQMGTPIFTDSIDTACVTFDQTGKQFGFMWNSNYYKKLTRYERAFVICHECLHVILNHGHRARGIKREYQTIANVAMDVVINELLVSRFGFEKQKISNWKDLCWLETVFKNYKDVEAEQTFEYYFRILKENIKIIKLPFMLVDSHDGIMGSDWEEVIDKLNNDLTEEEKETLKETIKQHFQNNKDKKGSGRGNTPGGMWTFANVGYTPKKKKWETVIKKWSMQFKSDLLHKEQWSRINRRFVLLPDDLMLPSEMEEEELSDPKKITVWFFQDTSASCSAFKDRFFKAADSLPPNRFDVKMHCFDTQVFETTLESRKLYGGGGTSFHILEEYVQQYCRTNKEEYPQAVFVVTDGYGTIIQPEIPQRWYFFLSAPATYCIPKECNIYKLKDYE